jgi:hypothetical protein
MDPLDPCGKTIYICGKNMRTRGKNPTKPYTYTYISVAKNPINFETVVAEAIYVNHGEPLCLSG